MKRILAASASLAALALPAAAWAASPGLVRQYDHTYQKARQQFGPSAVGCNLTGRRGSCHVRVTDATLTKSLGVLDRLWAPPPAPVSAVRTAYPAPGPVNAPETSYAPRTAVYASPSRSYGSSYRATSAVSSAGSGGGGGYSSSGGCGGNTPYSGGGQCWAIPYSIVSCESGGQNIPNHQGSGANGYYQLMSGGGGSRASQDAAAAALWAGGRGAGNWVCK